MTRFLVAKTTIGVAAVLLLTACSGEPAPGEESFSTVEAVRDAYVDAGGECGDWSMGKASGPWAQWGTCEGGSVTLSTYTSDADLQTVLDDRKVGAGTHPRAFVGANWIISGDMPEALGSDMGATVVDLKS